LPYLGPVWCSIIVEQNTNINEPVAKVILAKQKRPQTVYELTLYTHLYTRYMISFQLQWIELLGILYIIL